MHSADTCTFFSVFSTEPAIPCTTFLLGHNIYIIDASQYLTWIKALQVAVAQVPELVETDSNDAISNEIAISRIIDRSRNASGGTLHCLMAAI